MTTESQRDADESTPYFFLMTVQLRDRSTATLTNVVNVAPGDSRAKVFNIVRRYVADEVGASAFNILFFSLEPNRL